MDPYNYHPYHHTDHNRRDEPPSPPYPPPPNPYDLPPAPPFAGAPPHHYPPSPPPYHRQEPPQPYGHYEQPPPPPYTADHYRQKPLPPPYGDYQQPPDLYPPPPYTVEHHHHPPPPPPDSTIHHHVPLITNHHHIDHENYIRNMPVVRVYTKAKTDYVLTIREGKVILAPSNPSDPFQNWIKDEKFSVRVKDEEGFPAFALVNKATGEAMKHSIGATYSVQLTKYDPNKLDESVLWTQSKDLGDGYRAVRMVNNIRLNVDAYLGDKNHGRVHDGTKIVLWEWNKGDNQRWTIVPY